MRTIQARQGLSVGCPEEIAWRNGFIDDEACASAPSLWSSSGYGAYLLELLNREDN